ncbi:unnamed protein product, partial [Vitis vinifera]
MGPTFRYFGPTTQVKKCPRSYRYPRAQYSYTMKPISDFLRKLTSSREWSLWWESSNSSDELTRVTLALALIFLAIYWCAWVFIKKQGAAPPPPGPRGLPLLGHLPFLDPELHSYFADLARIYGPILQLRLGSKVGVVVSSPALTREVLKDQDVTFANRDVPEAALEAAYGGSDIVWTPYGPEWRMLRKVCVREMLSSTTLDSVYALRHREIRQTVSHLYSQAGLPVNIGEQTFLTVLNVITSMLWGGTVKGEERTSLGAEMEMDKEGGNGGGKDFLQYLLKLKDEGDSKTPFTMTHLKALLMDMVVGGTDTTSNTVEFAMAEIMNKPEVMKKVEQELEAVVGKDNMVEESHIQKLPYLYAVMKETLRLHPALPLLVPHCPSEPCIVGGFSIPKGARVFVNVWAIHRDPSIWKNPMEFDPERFLRGAWDYSGNDFSYFPFGSGRRICAGIAMAERMTMFSLATLLHSFHWKLPEGKLDLSEKFGIVLKKKVPLVAIPTPRLSDAALYK